MKKVYLFIISLFISSSTILAQNSDTTKRAQNVYFEILGPGVLYSANYDTRFSKRQDGLGIRAGISYATIEDASLFTVPVQLNYLLGKGGKYFEVGLGATYGTASVDFGFMDDDNETGSTVIGTMTFGYRRQPVEGGFMFRAGVSPVFGHGSFVPYWPYVSFGYSF
jgi:hypothetical protein